MFVVRYARKNRIIDLEVCAEHSLEVCKKARKIYGKADLIFIDSGTEYCIC